MKSAKHIAPSALNEARLSALEEMIGSLHDDEALALGGALQLILERHADIASYRPAERRARA